MAPFVFLVGGFGVLRLVGLLGVDALDAWQPALRGGLALMFLATGLAHFVQPKRRELIAMVPPA
ncbi:DoxX family protein, partial [Streptomyces sp. 8K308]